MTYSVALVASLTYQWTIISLVAVSTSITIMLSGDGILVN